LSSGSKILRKKPGQSDRAEKITIDIDGLVKQIPESA